MALSHVERREGFYGTDGTQTERADLIMKTKNNINPGDKKVRLSDIIETLTELKNPFEGILASVFENCRKGAIALLRMKYED